MPYAENILSTERVDRNFNFIILEVTKQMDDTLKVLENPSKRLFEKILTRDDYIDNLKCVIENKCFYSNMNNDLDKKAMDVIRAVNIITNNLEKMADYSVSIVSQLQHLKDMSFIKEFKCRKFFVEVLRGLNLINKALYVRNVSHALDICRTEYLIDGMYRKKMKEIIQRLKSSEDTESLVTMLFILSYLERMGDALLNIGEAIIFSIIGEKLKIEDFEALEDSIENIGMGDPLDQLNIESFWETKSGCKIRRVIQNKRRKEERGVIFKEGNARKLHAEKDNILRWEKVMPGLPPKIYNFQNSGQNASVLIEYLHGNTFQNIVLDGRNRSLIEVTGAILNTLTEIWIRTKEVKVVKSGFMRQLRQKIDDIYKVHPRFKDSNSLIGPLKTLSLEDLMNKAEKIEDRIPAPFSVFIHGDFNIDNIIFNSKAKTVHFIDLHRSKDHDYVQDISVFLVSNFRMPVFETKIRERLNHVCIDTYRRCREFAHENSDKTFDARLALGLARSFTTSTRFEFNEEFADAMHLRSMYLLNKLVNHKGSAWEKFSLPTEILVY